MSQRQRPEDPVASYAAAVIVRDIIKTIQIVIIGFFVIRVAEIIF